MRLYILALLGTALNAGGDALCVAVARGRCPRSVLVAAFAIFALSNAVWFRMTCEAGGGFVEPITTWHLVGVVFTVILALGSGDKQGPLEWVGFGLIVVGGVLRSLKH